MSVNALRARCLLAAAVCLLLSSGPAQANVVLVPDLGGTIEVVGMTTVNFDYPLMSTTVMSNPDGKSTNLAGEHVSAIWDYSWMIVANPDPFIDAVLTFTNLTSTTQTFNVSLNLPVAPPFSPGFKTGDLAFDFNDANADGSASVTNVDWTGLIDGSAAMSILSGGASCGGVGCSFALGPIVNGPLLHPAGVSSTLGILLSFELSAGDTATFDTRFEVLPVPLPAAAWLFGSALGLLGWLRRR